MALSTFVGQLTQPNATTGNQAITGVGFQPKAIIFFQNIQTADGASAVKYHYLGMATDSTHRAAVSFYQKDQNTQDDSRSHDNTKCLVILSTAAATLAAADFVSFDADGFTINWTTCDSVRRLVNYMVIGGADLTNATLKQLNNPTSTGDQAITGVGFKPDCVIAMSAGNSSAPPLVSPAGANGYNLILAVATGPSVGASYGADYHNQREKSGDFLQRVVGDGTDTLSWESTMKSFDADGFTLNWTLVNGARYDWALCLKGGNYKAGTETQKTSTGTKATTGIGFQPTGLLLFSGNDAVETVVNINIGHFSIGGASDTTHRKTIWGGVDATHADSDLDSTKIIKMMTPAAAGAPTTQAAADLSSFDANGFTLNWTTADATAREFVYLAFGSATLFPQLVASNQPIFEKTDINSY